MTLVWLALTLTFLVAVLVFISWDIGSQFRKQRRALDLAVERGRRSAEDAAWSAHRHAEHQRAISITLERAEITKVDDLLAALERASRPQLGVVA